MSLGNLTQTFTTTIVKAWTLDVHEHGLAFRSPFSNVIMKWDDVEQVTYSNVRYTTNLIPNGTRYGITIRDTLEPPGVLRIKSGFFGSRLVQLEFLQSWRAEKGHLYIFKRGDQKAKGVPIADIPNFFVLTALERATRQAQLGEPYGEMPKPH